VKTSETERWNNGKWRSSSKKVRC